MASEKIAIVATCNLNQWAMDFTGNLERIAESVARARALGARYRIGPELEVTGYGCEDHFLEPDTFLHSWEVLAELVKRGCSDNFLLDVGMPVMHHEVAYNCRVFALNRKIIFIRPKMVLADDGNYRESRWFRPWRAGRLEQHRLPEVIVSLDHSETCPIGEAILQCLDCRLASETCEELFTLDAPHIEYFLHGVDIISNGSGSHHSLRKLHRRIELLQSATRKGGGIYLYANQIGCDGGRLYYDGCALICLNGSVVAQAEQFTLQHEIEVIVAALDIGDVVSYRSAMASRGLQSSNRGSVFEISVKIALCLHKDQSLQTFPSPAIPVRYYTPEEEIAYGPACWLWDYLRRSGMAGFFLPLSGGADSSATATIVGAMCQLVAAAARDGNQRIIEDVRRITGQGSDFYPTDPRELASLLFHTCYMSSPGASSLETRRRAGTVADAIGAFHISVDIGATVDAVLDVFGQAFAGHRPKFKVHGGTHTENLAMQNVQARVRMVVAYLFAQLIPWARGKPGGLLVLGSANVDEGLRGYLTKYDCSSADINPIGGISKKDLRRFLEWASRPLSSGEGLGISCLMDVVTASPTAELEPITESYTQTDEQDMGMTYDDLTMFGRLRKLDLCGPLSMFRKLRVMWRKIHAPSEVAQKVKFFFRMYSINRHKMTTLTPSYHAENYSPEDNRFDLRPFLYNTRWPWQFRSIDNELEVHRISV
mmetsp:Transcript_9027/g.18241  ORF Transcript_9027/g.18241 Transcript_9027/m.18241 type:complete len:711 (-) Transcript_9027:845-2977(-)|eukprot:CAMPEP_0184679756 /NCGR_PEP_ID=MMETSP0312-20130426/2619_1 /TAXON_ID=31354 /ORGANISM="Compsopogon coeruleus, Strain SAG 36.94" /LENGTH=710 /DNA_ID=CAMNT_0027129415 /DNA_START=154 /DNA_END=2286 /DNA_ORIENTATION=-